MNRLNDTTIAKLSVEDLRRESARLEEQIRHARTIRVKIWKEIESRGFEDTSGDAQVVTPDRLEADVEINGESAAVRRRWWQRRDG